MTTRINFSAIFWTTLMLCAVGVSTSSFAQGPETELKRIMKEHGTVGLAVAVVKDGKIIYTQSLGLKNMEENMPLGDNDIFRIASISKSFTATAIMQLVESGKMSLDDDVSKLIGFEVKNPHHPYKVITLEMLLSHTSSITDSQKYASLDVINPSKNKTSGKSYADYAPGEGYRYSNLNYNMAGAIIERASNMRFDEYIKQNILDPLGLYGGYSIDSLDSDRFASIYFRSKVREGELVRSKPAYAPRSEEVRNYRLGYDTPILSPTGGLKISAIDLAKYMIMHMEYGAYGGVRIISEESTKRMQQPVSIKDREYGLGISTNRKLIEGKTLKGHGGSMYGLYSRMYFHPEEKFGFIAITNGNQTGNKVLNPVIVSLYEHFIKSGE